MSVAHRLFRGLRRQRGSVETEVKRKYSRAPDVTIPEERSMSFVPQPSKKGRAPCRDFMSLELLDSVQKGDFDRVWDLVVMYDADVNVRAVPSGVTPLHIAAKMGWELILCLLLEHGAVLNHVNGHGHRPIHYAKSELCKALLLSQGAGLDDDPFEGSVDQPGGRRTVQEMRSETWGDVDLSNYPDVASLVRLLEFVERQKCTELDMRESVDLFNTKPEKGVNLMIELGLLSDTPEDIAYFLRHATALDKAKVGEFVGGPKPISASVLKAYTAMFNFNGMSQDEALRQFLGSFRLPGEAQIIERIMTEFANRYVANNPNGIFANADAACVLAYSTIMLNTDAHNPRVKKKMQKAEFVRNVRGVNDGDDFPQDYLEGLYDRISSNEIMLKGDGGTEEKVVAVHNDSVEAYSDILSIGLVQAADLELASGPGAENLYCTFEVANSKIRSKSTPSSNGVVKWNQLIHLGIKLDDVPARSTFVVRVAVYDNQDTTVGKAEISIASLTPEPTSLIVDLGSMVFNREVFSGTLHLDLTLVPVSPSHSSRSDLSGGKDTSRFFFLQRPMSHNFPRLPCEEVAKWLSGIGLGEYTEHAIDAQLTGAMTLLLTDDEMRLELDMENEQHRATLSKEIEAIKQDYLTLASARKHSDLEPFDSTHPYAAMLVLELIEGKDLEARDSNGLSDPYALITYDGTTTKSRVIECNLNPVWNQELRLPVSFSPTNVIEIAINDQDIFSKDSPMGHCQVSLRDVKFGAPFEQWVFLDGVSSGLIHIRMTLKGWMEHLLKQRNHQTGKAKRDSKADISGARKMLQSNLNLKPVVEE